MNKQTQQFYFSFTKFIEFLSLFQSISIQCLKLKFYYFIILFVFLILSD